MFKFFISLFCFKQFTFDFSFSNNGAPKSQREKVESFECTQEAEAHEKSK